jgi:hypothetical protein
MIALLLLPTLLVGAETKGKKAAFLQSLVVPGWGQYSLGKKNAALAFFGTELALIGGMYSFRAYGRSARDDYKSMAAAYAGVVGNHPHDFYVDVGNWISVDAYNERRLQERNFDQLYTGADEQWQWDSDQHRAEMRLRRVKADRAFNSVLYLVGGLVLNHVASAIHAGRASSKLETEKNMSEIRPWLLGLGPASAGKGLRISFSRTF